MKCDWCGDRLDEKHPIYLLLGAAGLEMVCIFAWVATKDAVSTVRLLLDK